MRYYLVNLKNNKNMNQTKIKNVRLVKNDIEEYYESVPVLAYESGSFFSNYMIDIISGCKLYSYDYGLIPNIVYTSRHEASDSDIIRIAEIYKSLSKEDIIRYIDGIKEIENDSINKYNDEVMREKNNIENYNNASVFLNSLTDNE